MEYADGLNHVEGSQSFDLNKIIAIIVNEAVPIIQNTIKANRHKVLLCYD